MDKKTLPNDKYQSTYLLTVRIIHIFLPSEILVAISSDANCKSMVSRVVVDGNVMDMQQVSLRSWQHFNFLVRAKTSDVQPLTTEKSFSNSSLTYHPFVLDVTVAVTNSKIYFFETLKIKKKKNNF